MGLVNEYEKLLQYLEDQKVTEKKPKKSKEEFKKEVKKEVASTNTKKILEEATIDDFKELLNDKDKIAGSSGFDVKEFESMMRSKLIEEYKTSQSYERPYISCGELYNCLRQSYYSRKRYQIDVSSQFRFSYLYLIQKVGNTIHEIFQNLYNFSQVEKTIISEKYKVKGRIDAIKGSNLYEIKSIDASKFNGKFIKEHYFQGLIYSYILLTEYDYKIDKITIIYVFRDLKNIKPFDLDVDLHVAKQFLDRAPILLTALESNVPPECIGASADSCKWCPYIKYCEKDGFKKYKPPFIKKNTVTKVEEPEKKTDKKTAFLL